MDYQQIYNLIMPHVVQFLAAVAVPALVALVKSERLALDNSTQANGIIQAYRLAKKALAIVPTEDLAAIEAKAGIAAPVVEALVEDPKQPGGTPTP